MLDKREAETLCTIGLVPSLSGNAIGVLMAFATENPMERRERPQYKNRGDFVQR